MGHYLSEMLDPSPIYTTDEIKGEKNFKKAKRIYSKKGYFKKSDKVISVTYHKMKGDDREWYEIHCKNKKTGGLHFISISVSQWKKG